MVWYLDLERSKNNLNSKLSLYKKFKSFILIYIKTEYSQKKTNNNLVFISQKKHKEEFGKWAH